MVNELMAKKFSLLGAMTLVTLFRWRAARVQAARLLPPAHGEDGAAALLSSVPLLLGRLLIACIFLRVGYYELHRRRGVLCTLRSALCALDSAPCALHPAPCTLQSAVCTLPPWAASQLRVMRPDARLPLSRQAGVEPRLRRH